MSAPLSFRDGRKRLAVLWFGFGAALFLILIVQTFGALGDKVVECWGWFLPNVMPTMMLVAANLVGDAGARPADAAADQPVDRFYYRLAMAVSGFYLCVILLILLGWRATGYEEPLQVMSVASLFVAPIQGVAAAIISIFFKKVADAKKPG